MALVLRAFDYSFDGVTALKAAPGDDIDFRDMTDGLQAEGYVLVEQATPAPDVAPVAAEPTEPALPEPEAAAAQDEPVAALADEQQEPPAAVEQPAEPAPKRKRR